MILRVLAAERTGRLEALSPWAVLGRGYAIATTPTGRAVRSAGEVAVGERLTLQLHRGRLGTLVEQVEPRGPDEDD